MNRLRVRVELNRRKTGVPMEEIVSVVDETRKFFHQLAEDVHIDAGGGEWLASNFDPESLNFTAEYNGPASPEQIQAFGEAFSGSTSLRRETIAQFTKIADYIGEDELVGFGLYQSDQETEPSDWRCLSRRDAARFSHEILMLAKATGESVSPAPLPAAGASVGGRRLFKGPREQKTLAADPAKWMREVEASLARRIDLLESKLEGHAQNLQGLSKSHDAADARFMKLLGAMESFWSQAPRQLAAPAAEPAAPPAPAGNQNISEPAPPPRRRSFGWKAAAAVAAAALLIAAAKSPEIARHFARSAPLEGAPPAAAAAIATPAETKVVPPQAALISVESAPEPRPAGPAPVPAKTPASERPKAPAKRATEARAPQDAAEMIHEVFLQVPEELRPSITAPVTVKVNVGIDADGKVTAAEVASTSGEGADLLTEEALKAARWFRFRPARLGKTAVASNTELTVVFDAGSSPAAHPEN
jgi:TonB family protein